jgi:hypothetical protein
MFIFLIMVVILINRFVSLKTMLVNVELAVALVVIITTMRRQLRPDALGELEQDALAGR